MAESGVGRPTKNYFNLCYCLQFVTGHHLDDYVDIRGVEKVKNRVSFIKQQENLGSIKASNHKNCSHLYKTTVTFS